MKDGKALRKQVSRSALGKLKLPEKRDPLRILEEQHALRLPELIGVRVGRMLQSPFAYYRGTAAVMAADLADEPNTGVNVVSCGDAHISNFGFFASPERTLLFDLNDFDEAGIAPWEWDLKRLAASAYIGGRANGMTEARCADAAIAAVEGYRTALAGFMLMSPVDRFYAQINTDSVIQDLSGKARKITRKATTKARSRTSNQVLERITTRGDGGELRIIDQPPVTRHVDHARLEELDRLYRQYRGTLREDTAHLLSQYKLVDFVLRVVGVGSVGTRCYVLALEGPGGDVIFLQAKEAQASVLVTYGRMPASIPGYVGERDMTEGHRVVAGQRILQAQSDPFLGHIVGYAGDKGRDVRADYFWRQFRDMKGSIEPSLLGPSEFIQYSEYCGRLLARGHSQSEGAGVVAAYLGKSGRTAEALALWSRDYSDQVEADFAALKKAADAGRFPVEYGV